MPLTFFSLVLVNLRSMKKSIRHMLPFYKKQNMKMTLIITGKQILDNFKTVEQEVWILHSQKNN